jgi:hypothetical protein
MRVSRKFAISVTGALAAVLLAAGPAVAHECYNASRSDTGNRQIAAHSPSYVTFDEIAFGFFTAPSPDGLGLCAAGAQYLLDQVDAAAALPGSGIDLNWVVSIRTVQAGGIDHSPSATAQGNLTNGTGIDHLAENAALGAIIEANAGTAAGMCA